jgi:hypothetical protein
VSDKNVTEDTVRNEHHKNVNVNAHWGYLIGVIAGAFVLMIGLIAILGTTGG